MCESEEKRVEILRRRSQIFSHLQHSKTRFRALVLVEPSESIFISCYVSTYIFVFISKAWCMPYKRPDSCAHKKLYLPHLPLSPVPQQKHISDLACEQYRCNFEWVDGIHSGLLSSTSLLSVKLFSIIIKTHFPTSVPCFVHQKFCV